MLARELWDWGPEVSFRQPVDRRWFPYVTSGSRKGEPYLVCRAVVVCTDCNALVMNSTSPIMLWCHIKGRNIAPWTGLHRSAGLHFLVHAFCPHLLSISCMSLNLGLPEGCHVNLCVSVSVCACVMSVVWAVCTCLLFCVCVCVISVFNKGRCSVLNSRESITWGKECGTLQKSLTEF